MHKELLAIFACIHLVLLAGWQGYSQKQKRWLRMGASILKAFVIVMNLVLVTPVFADGGLTDMKVGSRDASGTVTGAVGTGGAQNEAKQLVKCDKPFGKIAVYEPQDAIQKALMQFSLPSPTGLIRLMIQQSGCFVVVERGQAMQILQQERALAREGTSRGDSNMGGGQLAAADFVVTPEVQFSQQNAGGAGGGFMSIGSMFGPMGMMLGAVAGSVRFKQAQTTLILSDTRSGIQLAVAQGASEKADMGVGGLVGGPGGLAAMGAYGNTAEGKVIAAAFLDAYNNMVGTIRNSPELVRDTATVHDEALKTAKFEPAEHQSENMVMPVNSTLAGSVVRPKISKVGIYAKPSDEGGAIAFLTKGVEAVADGREENGFIFVMGDGIKGWVEKFMVRISPN
jgi:curli biogenesis system outer membrane secretion channel CsgG